MSTHDDLRVRWLCGLGAAGAAAFLTIFASVGASGDMAWLDRLQSLLPRFPSKVAIVELDPATVETLGWPLQKELYAAAFGALHAAHAKAIGADIFFTQREQGAVDLAPVQLMGAEAQRAGVVLATYVVEGVPPGQGPALPPSPPSSRVDCAGPSPHAWARPLLEGLEGKAQVGHVQAAPDFDGTYRTMATCQAVHDGCLLDLASRLTGNPVDGASCRTPELVPFFRPFDAFPRLSFGRLLELTETAAGRAELEQFASGRVVLFGLTDPTLGDFGPTPRGSREPLVSLHANRVDALLAGVHLGSAPPPALALGSLLLAALALWRLERARTLLLGAATMVVASLAASALTFRLGLLWVPPAPLLLPGLCGCLAAAAWEGFRYFRFNLVLDQAFGMYVAPEVLSWLKETGGAALQPSAAQTREVSVLFSDIAGYTSLSNSLPAAQVMDSLRFYLDEMVAIVRKHGGFVDKINGDGLMVLFGAPRTSPGHAQEALACAREMQARVATANERWKAITGTELRIRVGVATGTAFTGNLGGEGHFEYSAIGRVVNLAARLEGKCEIGGVLLSESNWTALGEKPTGAWRELELKGYEAQAAVRAWQISPG